METISISTELDAPADVVWRAVKTPHAFVHVAKGMLRYPAAERAHAPWKVGDRLDGWTFLFGVVPFSVHHLEVASIDDERRVLVSHEHGGLVRTWHHTLVVTEVDDASCRYEDRIDIDAGIFTPVVASYASIFYRYRQRRWRRLARLLAAASAPADAASPE
jgi:hypothetical protein